MKKSKLFSLVSLSMCLVLVSGCSTETVYEDRIIVPAEEETEQESEEIETGDTSTGQVLGCEVDGILYFATGEKSFDSTYQRGVLTTNIDKAAIFTFTETSIENAYYLSTEVDNTTQYLYFAVPYRGPSNNPYVAAYTETPTLIYYDAENDLFIDQENTHYLCWLYEMLGTDYIEDDGYTFTPIRLMDKPTITSLSIGCDEQDVTEGFSVSLKTTYTPSSIQKANLTWSSSDESIATVKDGKVTGVKAGTCTISATTLNSVSASYEVTVQAKTGESVSKSVTITPTDVLDDLDLNIYDNLSTSKTTYNGFDIEWSPSQDSSSTALGISVWTGHPDLAYQKCFHLSRFATFNIVPNEGTNLKKVTLVGASSSTSHNGVWYVDMTNTDFVWADTLPTQLDEIFDMIEGNVKNETEEVVVSNTSTTSACNVYSITLEYEIVM